MKTNDELYHDEVKWSETNKSRDSGGLSQRISQLQVNYIALSSLIFNTETVKGDFRWRGSSRSPPGTRLQFRAAETRGWFAVEQALTDAV